MDFRIIEDKLRVDALFELYSSLLTEKQKEVMALFLMEDISESEIAENLGITRQAVHDKIRKCCRTLEDFESKLRLLEKTERELKFKKELLEICSPDGLNKRVMELLLKYDI